MAITHLEGSDSRYITEKEVENLSEAERRLAKNEIYARHGRMFEVQIYKITLNQKAGIKER